LWVQLQNKSGNSEPIYAGIATRRFDNPWVKLTGSPILRQDLDRTENDSGHSDDGGLSAPSNQTETGTSQVNGRFL
jgi:hypothetical protein